jgi:hypothetical protein
MKKRLRQHRGPHQVLPNRNKGQTKRSIIHTGGACKKYKAHKTPPEYTITEDDADLVAEMVQDRTTRILKKPNTKGTDPG